MIQSFDQSKKAELLDLENELTKVKEIHEQYINEKNEEISNLKNDFLLELNQNNEFVLNQINALRQELDESR